MLTFDDKPKFFILNAVRALSMVSLLLVLIANSVILIQDIQAVSNESHATAADIAADKECGYIRASNIPNQTTGTWRAFLIIGLNIVEILILFFSETGFPASFFKRWMPFLDNEHNLVSLGVLQLLLAAQMTSHFLDPFPLVASIILGVTGILNILTMTFKDPKYSRSGACWQKIRADAKV